eukprot:TRINITY_DN6210_c0_g1_i1.p1 TRINITY_DN6210_c0_g1~~TRINITY_DN6210_c0_g1_i1.p1  ORF type:complete len:991 (+),score=169.37 TRINITY_DN6210_c0_g1_i1:119-3091(+)
MAGQLAHILIDAFFTDEQMTYAIANVVDPTMASQMLAEQDRILQLLINDTSFIDQPLHVRCGDRPLKPMEVEIPISPSWLYQPAWEGLLAFPDRTAIVSGAHSTDDGAVCAEVVLTYEQVGELVVKLAWQLRQMLLTSFEPWAERASAEECVLVGIVMVKGWEQVVGAMAVQMAGAAYLPISAEYPMDRVCRVMELGSVRIALTLPQFVTSLDWPTSVTLLPVTRGFQSEIPLPGSVQATAQLMAPARAPTRQDLAYVIFTSGSTGEPKGVMLDHTGPLNTCLDCNQRFEMEPSSVVLGISELTFDLSVWDIFGTLATGATLVLPQQGASRDPAVLADLVQHYNVTHWNSVPQFVVMLSDHLGAVPTAQCDSLKIVMMSGDFIPKALPRELHQLLPDLRMVSMGGATEGSIWSIIYEIGDPATLPAWPTVPYGHAMANQEMFVLDCSDHHRPVCVAGEIAIGGVGVAQGYWRSPEKTNRQFKLVNGEWTYLTGDMGRWRSNGEIEFLGRKDSQVKLQGFRVELGEVEHAALKCDSVEKAVASVYQQTLICYCVCNTGADEVDVSNTVKALCTEALPPYMVPSIVMLIDKIPISANGKLDRKQLPAPALSTVPNGVSSACHSLGVSSQHEDRVLALFEELLPGSVGMDDDFFQQGGNSVLAVRLINSLNRTFGSALRVSALLGNRTARAIAGQIQSAHDDTTPNVVLLSAARSTGPKVTDDAINVFVVHGIGGDVLSFHHLAKHLSSACPNMTVYGIQASSNRPQRESVSQIAKRYLSQIRKLQPSGPLHLVGWSFGGHVCCEIALEIGPELTGSLIFIDTFAAKFEHSITGVPSESELLQRYWADLSSQFGIGTVISPAAGSIDAKLKMLLTELQTSGAFAASMALEDIRQLFLGYSQNAHALFTYTPPTACSEAYRPVLLKAAEPPLDGFEMYVHMNERALGWELITPNISVVELPGDHFSMVIDDKNSLALAREIVRCTVKNLSLIHI